MLTSEGDRVGDIEILGSYPHCGQCPVIVQYFFQTSINIHTICQTKYSWHHGNYARLNAILADIDWEYELFDLPVDKMFTKLRL